MANADSTSSKFNDYFALINEQLNVARAICDAAAILTALEKAPSHHDTHPSHNILTGGGFAHGLRVSIETFPNLLKHAGSLIDLAHNDADCMKEAAIESISVQKAGGIVGGFDKWLTDPVERTWRYEHIKGVQHG